MTWQVSGTDTLAVIRLPAALQRAIQAAAPGWRLRDTADVSAPDYRDPAAPGASTRAVVADLDRNGGSEAVLWGNIADSTRTGIADGMQFRVDREVILGVSATPSGYLVRVLHARSTEVREFSTAPRSGFALHLVAGPGMPVSVTWMDGDCRSDGIRIRRVRGQWKTTPSRCDAGD